MLYVLPLRFAYLKLGLPAPCESACMVLVVLDNVSRLTKAWAALQTLPLKVPVVCRNLAKLVGELQMWERGGVQGISSASLLYQRYNRRRRFPEGRRVSIELENMKTYVGKSATSCKTLVLLFPA